jgi:hypothetical protein
MVASVGVPTASTVNETLAGRSTDLRPVARSLLRLFHIDKDLTLSTNGAHPFLTAPTLSARVH